MSRHRESFICCRQFGSTHTANQEQVDLMAALVSETKAAVCAVVALCRTPEVRRKKATLCSTSGRESVFFFIQDNNVTTMPLQHHQPGIGFYRYSLAQKSSMLAES